MSLSIVDVEYPRAVHEATNPSTQSAWNRSGSAGTIGAETPPFTTRKPAWLTAHLLLTTTIEVPPNNTWSYLAKRGPSNNPNKPSPQAFSAHPNM